jgi:hypothetical protein
MKIAHLDPMLLAEEDVKAVTNQLKVDAQQQKSSAIKAIQVTKPGEIDITALQDLGRAGQTAVDTGNTDAAMKMIRDPNFEPNMKKIQKQLVQTMHYMSATIHRVIKFTYNQFVKEPRFQKYAPKEWAMVQTMMQTQDFKDNEARYGHWKGGPNEEAWTDWELPKDMGPDGIKITGKVPAKPINPAAQPAPAADGKNI